MNNYKLLRNISAFIFVCALSLLTLGADKNIRNKMPTEAVTVTVFAVPISIIGFLVGTIVLKDEQDKQELEEKQIQAAKECPWVLIIRKYDENNASYVSEVIKCSTFEEAVEAKKIGKFFRDSQFVIKTTINLTAEELEKF